MSRKPRAVTWHDIIEVPPPEGEPIWAYCLHYGLVHLAMFNGWSKNDYGEPSIDSMEEEGDDYYLRLWTKCDVPEGPAQDILDKLRKEE